MTERKEEPDASKSGVDLFIERITGRVGKITALVIAIGGLAAAIVTQSDKIRTQLVTIGWYAPRPCVSIDSTTFPETVKFSEWDKTTVRLHGRKDCATELGVYVTFFRDVRNEQLFRVQPPRGEFKECKELRADLYPNCWHYKKPLKSGKGEWSWDVPLPPLERVSEPRRVERLFVSWSVRNYDDPAKPAIFADTAVITVQNDAGNTIAP